MRRKFAIGAATLVLAMLGSGSADADRLRQRGEFGAPGWVLPGAALDLDFAQGQYWGTKSCRSAATCLNVSRASPGTVQDDAGNVVSFASDQPRITNQGILVEESRANSQPYNEMAGAASPNVYPTGWSVACGGNGVIMGIVGTGTENGIPYADFQLSGTTTAAQSCSISFIGNDETVAAANSQTWTSSFFRRLSGGSFANLSATDFIDMWNSSGTFLAQLGSSSLTPSATTLGQGRIANSQTLNQSSTAYANHYLNLAWAASGLNINVTLRLGGVQLEQGLGATSLIFTNGAAGRAPQILSPSPTRRRSARR
jgi:hypothetical protein